MHTFQLSKLTNAVSVGLNNPYLRNYWDIVPSKSGKIISNFGQIHSTHRFQDVDCKYMIIVVHNVFIENFPIFTSNISFQSTNSESKYDIETNKNNTSDIIEIF